jgi:hypothetical protein
MRLDHIDPNECCDWDRLPEIEKISYYESVMEVLRGLRGLAGSISPTTT